MQVLLILSAVSFVLALLLTALCRNLFLRAGIVDHPDGLRKLHAAPVPNMGGIPIAAACLASFGILFLLGLRIPARPVDVALMVKLLPAAGIIFATGILDDRYRLQPIQKLIAQVLASGWAFYAGVHITGIVGHRLPPWLSFAVTMFWLIACTNAFNLIDGVDGLAAGVGLFATATTLIAALMQENLALAAVMAPLLGALLGFLRYNFNPATIFLGDSGSLLIGFVLGCCGVIWSQKAATILGMTAPLIALSIPILDVCLSVVRRFLRREPLLRGDRSHIHHRLLDRGFTPRRAVVTMYAACGIAACFSIFQSFAESHYSGLVVLVFCGIAWIGVQNLGYAEFDQARKMILAGGFRRALNSQLILRAFEQSIASAASLDECWDALQEAGTKLGFAEVHWSVAGTLYHKAIWRIDGNAAWSIKIPLEGSDFVSFGRASDTDPLAINISVLANAMRDTIGAKDGAPAKLVHAAEEALKKTHFAGAIR